MPDLLSLQITFAWLLKLVKSAQQIKNRTLEMLKLQNHAEALYKNDVHENSAKFT